MYQSYAIAAAYAFAIIMGIFGNTWVAISVVRSRRPRSTMGLSPSDRLRSYIGLLAVVDLLVIASLFIRFVHVILPEVNIEPISCQIIFVVDQLVKLTSLTCLTCISFERYLTIAKPFKNTIRKKCIRFTPLVAISVICAILTAIVALATNMTVTTSRKDCAFRKSSSSTLGIARWAVDIAFIVQLVALCFNYGQIARHLRRRFTQRRSRICTNPRMKQPLVQQPKYMKDTTNVILRIATFHFVCWAPYCVVQVLPASMGHMSYVLASKLRVVTEPSNVYQWIVFGVSLLAYLNSALDWVFYAVMNRDLRTIIRETTERRKRSTMSQHSPPSALHQSLRRQISQSLRFFYSINSYRSACNSFDESVTSCQVNGSRPDLKRLSSSVGGGSTGALNNEDRNQGTTITYVPAMRSGRAHTFSASPRTSLLSQDSVCSTPITGSRYTTVAIMGHKYREVVKDTVEKFV
uniref:G_PROTEIN_RECEP_F1_2 domain-containing protein n=1 Tax=Panagrellus redivivus TaxID=6233 RepID=A0A7E4W8H9_PANRE